MKSPAFLNRLSILILLCLALIPGFAVGAQSTSAADFANHERIPPSLPRRTILLVIDGLAVGAIERLPMVNLESLKSEGVYYRELVLPLAAHPRLSVANESDPRYYPWSCSIPNPVMMTGTVFIGQPGIKATLLQHIYKAAGKGTAFYVDSDAYTEIAGGYDTFRQDWKSDDDSPVLPAVQKEIEDKNPHFIRIHLQSTGAGGYVDRKAQRSIWDANAEYRRRAIKADALIGQFVSWLKEKGFWNDTLLLVCGDHGQADTGGHAPYEPFGDKTALIIAGKGIKRGVAFAYAEMVDIAPTIAHVQGIAAPKYNQGRVLAGALVGGPDSEPEQRHQDQLNEIMRQHRDLTTRHPSLASSPLNQDFLVIEQIGTWHKKFRDLPSLLKHQREVLEKLKVSVAAPAPK